MIAFRLVGPPFQRHVTAFFVALAGVLSGMFAAVQPIATTAIILTAGTFVLLGLVTPLAALVALLVISPLRTLVATEASLRLPLDIGQIAVIVVLAVWAAYRVARRQRLLQLERSPLIVVLVAFLFATALSAFSAISIAAWATEWLKWLLALVLVVIVVNAAGQSQWETLSAGLVLAGVANAVIGLYEFFGGSGALHLLIGDRFFRAFGTFGQPNPFGGFMGLLAPFALMMAIGYAGRCRGGWRETCRIPRGYLALAVYYGLSFLALLSGLIASWSRGAWLGFGLAVAVVAFALPRRLWQSLTLVGVVVGLVVFAWLSGRVPLSVAERLTSATAEFFSLQDIRGVDITPENYAVFERLAHWQAALNMIAAHPWLGVGFGNYEFAYPQYRLMNWHFALGHAHNYYLNIWAETGIIGLLAYGAFWLVVFSLSWRTRRHPDFLARCAAVGLLGTWTYIAVHSFLDNLYVNNLFLHLGVMLGVLGVLYIQTWKHLTLNL